MLCNSPPPPHSEPQPSMQAESVLHSKSFILNSVPFSVKELVSSTDKQIYKLNNVCNHEPLAYILVTILGLPRPRNCHTPTYLEKGIKLGSTRTVWPFQNNAWTIMCDVLRLNLELDQSAHSTFHWEAGDTSGLCGVLTLLFHRLIPFIAAIVEGFKKFYKNLGEHKLLHSYFECHISEDMATCRGKPVAIDMDGKIVSQGKWVFHAHLFCLLLTLQWSAQVAKVLQSVIPFTFWFQWHRILQENQWILVALLWFLLYDIDFTRDNSCHKHHFVWCVGKKSPAKNPFVCFPLHDVKKVKNEAKSKDTSIFRSQEHNKSCPEKEKSLVCLCFSMAYIQQDSCQKSWTKRNGKEDATEIEIEHEKFNRKPMLVHIHGSSMTAQLPVKVKSRWFLTPF